MGLVGIPLAVWLDPLRGWCWAPYNRVYDEMMVSIYITIGAFMLVAARDPLRHVSYLWFVVFSSVAHGAVMLFHALTDPRFTGHLFGDVWILSGALGLFLPLRAATRP